MANNEEDIQGEDGGHIQRTLNDVQEEEKKYEYHDVGEEKGHENKEKEDKKVKVDNVQCESDHDNSQENVNTSTPTMDPTTTRPENPYLNASFLSKFFFRWPYSMLQVGIQRTLEEIDLPNIMEQESSSYNRNRFEKIWTDELKRVEKYNSTNKNKKIKPSLHRALLVDFFKSTWIIQPMMFFSSVARIVMSLALGNLTQAFIDSDDGAEEYLWAGVLVVCNFVVLMEHHHVFFITSRKGMNMRTAAVAAIFSKSLRLSSIGSSHGLDGNHITSGQIMNLVSNDVERFFITALFMSYLIWAPLQSIAILVIGIKMIGLPFLVGMGILLFVFVPVQVYLSKKFAFVRSKVASITDSRVTLVSQAITGVRVMKMSAWEFEFQNRINKIREKEIKQIQKAYGLYSINETLFFATNVVIPIIIFAVHVLNGGSLTPKMVFTIFSFVTVLQIELTKHLSLGIMSAAECFVSVRRIQNFIETPELPMQRIEISNMIPNDEKCVALSLRNLSCYWDFTAIKSSDSNSRRRVLALDNINVDLKMNELTCVIGSVGSGKTALLLALAGELSPHQGSIRMQKGLSVAYATQDPWIMNGTIKDNILMGRLFDKVFYSKIIKACGLDVDFENFIDGEYTIVGDRGVQCSGGQRARIGLARALYRNADVLLLDDPLSAVDSRVGSLIFHSAIRDLALKYGGKCIILVTHQHQYVGESRCLLMSKGRIKVDGSFKDCVAGADGKIDFVTFNEERGNLSTEENGTNKDDLVQGIPSNEGIYESRQIVEKDDQQETKVSGVVSNSTFLRYAKSMGGLWVAIWIMTLFALSQAASLASVAFVGRWSERPLEMQRAMDILVIVFALAIGVVLLAYARSVLFFKQSLNASKQLHQAMLSAVFRARIEFFDTNPSGRILNRFSADVGSNDELLPKTFYDFLLCSFIVLGSMVTAITALPYILITMPPLVWYFLKCRNIFVTSSREIKRFEGLARSPIFAMLNESINGIATVRVNDAILFIREKFEACHNTHSRAFFSFVSASRWVGFRMDSIMFLTVSTSCVLAAIFSDQGWFQVDPVIFGLALSMLLQLGSIFQWTIRQSAEVVNQMVCVERVSEYSMLLSEAPLTTPIDAKFPDWPASGEIDIERFSVRYRSTLPLSLRSISLKIQSGQRIGVVGRTGSGKSTLVQSLFRILEAERGSISIDGIDTSRLGLHKLRTAMSVINQHPVLFSGCTVRENLDPFEKYSDEVIQAALADVQMLDAVEMLPGGLHSNVSENGSNFSVGERQLLCLARATLQKTKILVLDEPTANVDSHTDQLLQDAVNKSFTGSTIISVAHRLDTIIENDLILVLGNGEVLEYGCPRDLIDQDGHFTKMVDETGEEMSSYLRKKATTNH